ncbi:MAG TPA: sigma-70 family RNA polymerase sigma factor [Burkholderiales bacterium]|jgi:RNA polymerase sigma-70 factor (ECF subfamily)
MEQEALVELIPRLRRYARALTGERFRADDLVQDTLERALAKWALWRPGTDLRAWTFTIMHNVFVNQVRRAALAPEVADPEAALELEDSGASADTLAQLNALDGALQRLPDEQREVLLLVTLEGFSYDEAAHTLGLPIGTVMSRLARARAKLAALLEGEGTKGAAQVQLKVVK